MAVSAFIYSQAFEAAFNDQVDLDSDTIKVALLTAYTPNQDAHDFFNDVSGTQITGSDYTSGGATLGSKSVGTSGKVFTFDAADVTWSSSTLSATHAVVYVDTGNSSTSPLLVCVDFDGTISSTNGDFTIQWDAGGIFTVTVA